MTKAEIMKGARMSTKNKMVKIGLDELQLLCLNVDYKIKGTALDAVEELSVEFGKRFKFDTHKYRLQLKKLGIDGAV